MIVPADEKAVIQATNLLDEGRLVVVPTDTLYGLAADALNEEAVLEVFRAKNRASDQALPVCVGGIEDVQQVATPNFLARKIASAFWPGPVTIVMKAKAWLPDALTAHGDSVAVRAPAHAWALQLARTFGPYTLTSANKSGQPETMTAIAAAAAMGDAVSLVVDGGSLGGIASTIVDCTTEQARIIRVGGVPADEVLRVGRTSDRELQESG